MRGTGYLPYAAAIPLILFSAAAASASICEVNSCPEVKALINSAVGVASAAARAEGIPEAQGFPRGEPRSGWVSSSRIHGNSEGAYLSLTTQDSDLAFALTVYARTKGVEVHLTGFVGPDQTFYYHLATPVAFSGTNTLLAPVATTGSTDYFLHSAALDNQRDARQPDALCLHALGATVCL